MIQVTPFPWVEDGQGLETLELDADDSREMEPEEPLPTQKATLPDDEAEEPPGEVAPLPVHRTELSDGQRGHRLHLLIPTPQTPGFDLCSGRCFQVWLALAYHAERHGYWGCPDALPGDERYQELRSIRAAGLAAAWTVDLLARTCGVDPKTASRAMQELRDLGWLRYSKAKDREGLFVGIVYVLTPPPTKLTSTATYRYREQIEKKKAKLAEEEARLQRGQPDYEAMEEDYS